MRLLFITANLSLLSAVPAAAWDYITPSHYCLAACAIVLDKVTFQVANKTQKNACAGLYAESVFDCLATYCSEAEIKNGLHERNETCIIQHDTPLPPFVLSDSLSQVVKVTEKSVKTTNYTTAVVPDSTYFEIAFKTIYAKNTSATLDWAFAWTLCGYWGLVVCIGVLVHLLNLARGPSNDHLHSLPKAEGVPIRTQSSSVVASITGWIRRRILLPLLFSDRQPSKLAGGSVPTRVEALGIAFYLILNVVFCFPGYHLFVGNLNRPTIQQQTSKYIANRAGCLALANLPVIWVFAARNNPFLWLTGWPYSTYSQFHRWAARVATLEAITHAICYSVLYHYTDTYVSHWSQPFWWCGVITLTSMSLLVFSSTNVFRQYRYEAFLVTHFVLAMIVLVCLYLHVDYMTDSSFNDFLRVCATIWVIDRAARLVRVFSCSFLRKGSSTRAFATYEPDSDIIRLDVSTIFQTTTPTPGSFYYIYEPRRLFGYESHPFTLCSWSRVSNEKSRPGISEALNKEMAVESGDNKTATTSTQPTAPTPANTHQRHTFLIRPRGGFTQQLKNKILNQGPHKAYELTILLEGPYGQTFPLSQHSDILMIVGGSGITAAVSRAYALLRTGGPRMKLHLVWAAHRKPLIDTVCADELKELLEDPRVRLDIYLTRETPNVEFEKTDTADVVGVHTGRPDMAALVKTARLESGESLGIFCSGPLRMGMDCRRIVTELLGDEGKSLGFYEERFVW